MTTPIDVLLVSLRDPFMDSDRVMPPLGVMALHAHLLDLGFTSRLEIDFRFDRLAAYAHHTHIGISCMTPQKEQAYGILHAIKAAYPEIRVILGGPHARYYLEECQRHPFDHIVVGDGELALEEILTGRIPPEERIVSRPVSVERMNRFPLPYREPGFLGNYDFVFQGIHASTLLTAKGCPMSCTFCEDARTKVKMYHPDYVGRQIEQIKQAGFAGVMFFDDVFTLSPKRVRELTAEIANHRIRYRCFGHARTMTPEIAGLLSGTGCIETGVGVESGSQKILDAVDKKTTVARNRDYVRLCNAFGIRVKTFLMLGLPGEDEATLAQTERFLEFLMGERFTGYDGQPRYNDFDLTIYFPYVGTGIRRRIDAGLGQEIDLWFTSDPDGMSGFYKGVHGRSEVAVRTSALSAEALIAAQQRLTRTYKRAGSP
ncbi:MAG: B12-binding domain-containing radical SAM protein [Magnetococcales bacterium]|nr:B12-binding domain-containing radical SAM protein [Magnetococcales bacterium]